MSPLTRKELAASRVRNLPKAPSRITSPSAAIMSLPVAVSAVRGIFSSVAPPVMERSKWAECCMTAWISHDTFPRSIALLIKSLSAC